MQRLTGGTDVKFRQNFVKYKLLNLGRGLHLEDKPNVAELEVKFYAELTVKAGMTFDWSKEKNPKKKQERSDSCIKHMKKLMEKKSLVQYVFYMMLYRE